MGCPLPLNHLLSTQPLAVCVLPFFEAYHQQLTSIKRLVIMDMITHIFPVNGLVILRRWWKQRPNELMHWYIGLIHWIFDCVPVPIWTLRQTLGLCTFLRNRFPRSFRKKPKENTRLPLTDSETVSRLQIFFVTRLLRDAIWRKVQGPRPKSELCSRQSDTG